VATMLDRISMATPRADIFVVDDNSTDGTLDVLEAMRRDNLKVLVRPSKLGLGSAHLLAWNYAIQQGYEALVTMDGDNSHDPADIPRLLAALAEGCDLVVGSRYVAHGICDYTGYRKYVSRIGNSAARTLLPIALSEFTTSFRAFRVVSLKRINFDTLRGGGYSFFLAVIVQAYMQGLAITEVPIHFHERNAGTSKIPPLEIFRGIWNLLRLAAVCRARALAPMLRR